MINSTLVKKLFNRNAAKLAGLDFILQELASRMISRLDYIKVTPGRVLDCGSGLGIDAALLQKKYPDALIYQLDIAINLLRLQLQPKSGWLQKVFGNRSNPKVICANAAELPITNGGIDFFYSNMLLPYLGDIVPFVKEMRRVLSIGGAFCIAGLGVDSFKELRELGLSTYNFPDMHDIGDILAAAGFTNPVVDTEYITLEYEHLKTVFQDIKLVGCGSAHNSIKLPGKNLWHKINQLSDQPSKLTLEVFVAHGWKDRERIDLPDGVSGVNFLPKTKRDDQ